MLLQATRDAAAVLCGHIHERFQARNVICAGSSTMREDEGYWLVEMGAGRVARAELYGPGGIPDRAAR